uniref:DDE_Tnp_1_7 domain-containing protein n=1 Tax=Steinernema glaseri TaxID=37863 RepID=A0A1I8A442_9BILA
MHSTGNSRVPGNSRAKDPTDKQAIIEEGTLLPGTDASPFLVGACLTRSRWNYAPETPHVKTKGKRVRVKGVRILQKICFLLVWKEDEGGTLEEPLDDSLCSLNSQRSGELSQGNNLNLAQGPDPRRHPRHSSFSSPLLWPVYKIIAFPTQWPSLPPSSALSNEIPEELRIRRARRFVPRQEEVTEAQQDDCDSQDGAFYRCLQIHATSIKLIPKRSKNKDQYVTRWNFADYALTIARNLVNHLRASEAIIEEAEDLKDRKDLPLLSYNGEGPPVHKYGNASTTELILNDAHKSRKANEAKNPRITSCACFLTLATDQ